MDQDRGQRILVLTVVLFLVVLFLVVLFTILSNPNSCTNSSISTSLAVVLLLIFLIIVLLYVQKVLTHFIYSKLLIKMKNEELGKKMKKGKEKGRKIT